jgi:acid phosphatase (class A)
MTLSCRTAAHERTQTSDLTRVNGGPDWSHVAPDKFTMAPPPAPNSEAFKKDFEELLAEQESRTDEDCQTGRRQHIPSFKTLFESSPVLNDQEFKKDERLFDTVLNLTERIANDFKDQFDRPRPYVTNPTIKPCVPLISGNKSYPSSHAAMATVGACLIAKQFPDRVAEAEKYGQYLAELRIKIGVHHPSDVAAGIKLGQEVCAHLVSDKRFMRDFTAIDQH